MGCVVGDLGMLRDAESGCDIFRVLVFMHWSGFVALKSSSVKSCSHLQKYSVSTLSLHS